MATILRREVTMTYFFHAILYFGVLCAGLFGAACAVFVGLWGHPAWSGRRKHERV